MSEVIVSVDESAPLRLDDVRIGEAYEAMRA